MNTKLYLKATAVSIGFILTFGAAGLHGKVQASTDKNKPEASQDIAAKHQIVEKQISLKEKIKKPEKIKMVQDITPATGKNSSLQKVNRRLPEFSKEQKQNSSKSNSGNIKIARAVNQDKLNAKKTAENKIKNIKLAESRGSDSEQHKKLSNPVKPKNYTPGDYFYTGKTMLEKGDPDKAVYCFNKALEKGKKTAEVYLYRGNAYAELKKQEKAIDDYNKAIELNPDYADAYNNRGYIFFKKHDYENAIKDFKKAVKIKPDFSQAFFNRGNTHFAQRNFRKAASYYSKAIKINPEFISAYVNRGTAYYNKKSHRKAIRDFTKALELNENATVYILRGNTYREKSKHQEAINDYTKAINLSPDLPVLYIYRGQEYEVLNDYKKAIADYSKVIETAPEHYKGYLNRGNAYLEEKEYYSAISDYSKVLELETDLYVNIAAYEKRSEAYKLTNQYSKAENDLKMAERLASPAYRPQNKKMAKRQSSLTSHTVARHDAEAIFKSGKAYNLFRKDVTHDDRLRNWESFKIIYDLPQNMGEHFRLYKTK